MEADEASPAVTTPPVPREQARWLGRARRRRAPSRAQVERPIVSDEPIGAGPLRSGRRDDAPARFRAAMLTRLAGLGATFHYEGGLQAKVPQGRELECSTPGTRRGRCCRPTSSHGALRGVGAQGTAVGLRPEGSLRGVRRIAGVGAGLAGQAIRRWLADGEDRGDEGVRGRAPLHRRAPAAPHLPDRVGEDRRDHVVAGFGRRRPAR